jgi:hypothetical protein
MFGGGEVCGEVQANYSGRAETCLGKVHAKVTSRLADENE